MIKRFKLLTLLACALLTLSISQASWAQQKTYTYVSGSNDSIKFTKYTLENGLTVILSEDHTQPTVFGMTVTKAGSKNDPKDATGMAHYQEHMLFKGTEEIATTNWAKEKVHIDSTFLLYDLLGKTTDPAERTKIQLAINNQSLKANEYAIPNEFSDIIKAIGGTNLNANTSEDRTVYLNSFPPNQMERWLDVYSHRLMKPVFRGFQSELEVVYEEYNMYSDMFQTKLMEEFNKNMFKQHPYGQQTVIGTVEHLKNPSLTKMYEFFKTYYVANNMALVLVGDFNTNEIIPLIEAKFGRLQKGELPKYPEYKEEPFKGRELVEVKLTPIKLAVLGFRTVPNRNADEYALTVCSRILSNGSETGLLDKLVLNNKVMMAQFGISAYNDYGYASAFVVPKLLGQSLEEAEKLVIAELEKVAKGDFPDYMIESIKNELMMGFETSMESAEEKGTLLGEMFAQNYDMDEFLAFNNRIKAITKEDVMRVAQQYLGKNYLAIFSTMGFPKKEKIEKPQYKPVISTTNAKSSYRQYLEKLPEGKLNIKYYDFDRDMQTAEISKGNTLYYNQNPLNNIFSMTVKYGVGDMKLPLMGYATQYINFSGVKDMSVGDIKAEFAKIGCNYGISNDENYVYVSLGGLEQNLKPALQLLNQLTTAPVPDKEKLKIIIDAEKQGRKMERSEADNVGSALLEYARFKDKSENLDRLSMKEISKLNSDSLLNTFKKALQYECKIHYTGKIGVDKVKELLTGNYTFSNAPIKSESPLVRVTETYNENTVFVVNKKKSAQSKIYLFSNGDAYDNSKDPYIAAFNLYFGGDFSGLVLQEVREYRSLAYTASAGYYPARKKGFKSLFIGYVGTQPDKTIEALNVFDTLIRHMPEKAERMDMIKSYLAQSTISERPNFRGLTHAIEGWKLKGYTQDPASLLFPAFNNMQFSDIVKFYQDNIQKRPMVITIVSDQKRLDMKGLEKFGKIIMVKEKDLFKK